MYLMGDLKMTKGLSQVDIIWGAAFKSHNRHQGITKFKMASHLALNKSLLLIFHAKCAIISITLR